jgi:hypothetical protein
LTEDVLMELIIYDFSRFSVRHFGAAPRLWFDHSEPQIPQGGTKSYYLPLPGVTSTSLKLPVITT